MIQGVNGGLCDCRTKNYWDGTQCQQVKTYSQSCGYQAQCDQDQILICPVSGTNALKCSCAQNKSFIISFSKVNKFKINC